MIRGLNGIATFDQFCSFYCVTSAAMAFVHMLTTFWYSTSVVNLGSNDDFECVPNLLSRFFSTLTT
jgi:hypothetical protein